MIVVVEMRIPRRTGEGGVCPGAVAVAAAAAAAAEAVVAIGMGVAVEAGTEERDRWTTRGRERDGFGAPCE